MKTDFLKGKTVLITGGTGSFGSSFSRFLLENSKIKKLIIFSRDEFKQFHLQKEFAEDGRARFFLGDVRDLQRLERAFHGVALKQVPMLEYNPFEAVKTNILGTQNVIDAAIDCGVDKVLLISTDKAAQPVNLYGSTKLCAEKLVTNGNFFGRGATKLSCVRYGNVMGSRGSVVEMLLKEPNRKIVEITDIEMTRFWITLEQSFELVLFALSNMEGGEIFVPRIPSMKLVDLFSALAPKAKREVIGVRAGEKVHEVLLTREESRHSIELPDYYVILPHYDEEIFSMKDRYKKLLAMGEKLEAGFHYASDTNSMWLTKKDFAALLKKSKALN
jgi:UDP-N-acetylglucosamine 4,6-dehydratase